MSFMLPVLNYLCMRVRLDAHGHAPLPSFTGSMLRGALGNALRQAVCVTHPGQECTSCFFLSGCVYGRLYRRTIRGDVPPFLRGVSTPPRPYVLDVPPPRRGRGGTVSTSPSTQLSFGITLFGDVVPSAPYVTVAAIDAARTGLGAAMATFAVGSVEWARADGGWDAVFPPTGEAPSPATYERSTRQLAPLSDVVTIDFVTPLDLSSRSDGRHPETTPDDILRRVVFSALRRTLELAYLYQPWSVTSWDFREVIEAAREIRILECSLESWEGGRRSTTQQQRVPLQGLVGSMTITGIPTLVAPVLRLAELTNVGKKASHGFGRVRIVAG